MSGEMSRCAKTNVHSPLPAGAKGVKKAKPRTFLANWFGNSRVRWLTICSLPVLAFLLLNDTIQQLWQRSSGRSQAMPEVAVVDSGREPSFLSRIFRIRIEYDDRLDERAKLELSRGKKLMQGGRYLEALPYFDEVLATFPRNGDALFFRAQTLYRIGMFQRRRR